MLKKLSGVLLISALLFSSCQKNDLTENVTPNIPYSASQLAKFKEISLRIAPAFDLNKSIQTPATNSRMEASSMADNADLKYFKEAIESLINPSSYECSPTEFNSYAVASYRNWTANDINWYITFGDMPTMEAYYLDNTEGGDYYGINGEYTNVLTHTFRDLKKFWNSYPEGLQLADMHGTIYKDVDQLATMLKIFYRGWESEEEVYDYAAYISYLFGQDQFDNYNHVMFTLNAFAMRGLPELIPGYGKIPYKIVMGDGIMKALADLGYADIAPQGILAHEFGHQIQFKNGYFLPGAATPEKTRRTELMADTYAAYFLTSKKGASANKHRVASFMEVFFNIGDCSFRSTGHHGTPNQRMKAAQLGFYLADSEQKKGQQLTTEEVYAAFEAALPDLIAPDK